MHHPRRAARLLAGMAVAALTVTACGGGGGGAGGGEGSLAAIDLSGASFTVGSKEFTEQIVLGQIAVQALEATGADAGNLVTITGSTNVRTALTAGEIDMYWEYTGTGWTTHFQHEPQSAPDGDAALYQAVAEEDRNNGIAWLAPAPLDNTYAVATAEGRDQELGVRTLSEYAALVNRDPAQARMCAAAEFLTRDDGWPGLEQAYGFDLPADGIAELELSLIPQQTATGENCNFGEVTATDGAVAANNLVLLEDDKQFFVPYNAAMTVRQEVLDANPRLAEVFDPIAAKLTTELVRGLNERVDVGGELPEDVAEQFLQENGFIG
ncbi:glycine betaine ABC transporter substrate-binding protein [Pseudonocardia kunmingensis]|uniref:Osmoprotectant transport system substrate-binding protein n=1 Tax=Pseudonocardia kunmingensis TaxID=630975 RepID=A0A543D9E2_9PSEU|nr:glycine betaine ABC transporter substrate-binding protein [Pseudonocardia kunmingensis]TQM05942.1 osmoprotectant transport system substrate-binding protein [Pseudonocardia kunmingensis]